MPYFAWANRGGSDMRVWVPEQPLTAGWSRLHRIIGRPRERLDRPHLARSLRITKKSTKRFSISIQKTRRGPNTLREGGSP